MQSLAQRLFDAYHVSFGIEAKWDDASNQEKAAWEAVASKSSEGTMFKYTPGQRIADKYDVQGTVRSVSFDDHGRVGYWLVSMDSTGRPFEHYVEECDVVTPA